MHKLNKDYMVGIIGVIVLGAVFVGAIAWQCARPLRDHL